MKLPTMDDALQIAQADDYMGWCTTCGDWTHDCCEPDAHHYTCPECGNNTVFAATELLVCQMYKDGDDDESDFSGETE